LTIGGWPDPETRETKWPIEIPGLLSFLAERDFEAEVMGLNDVPMDEQPEPRVVHVAFQVMVGLGTAMIAASIWFWFRVWRRRAVQPSRWQLIALIALAPAGFIAIEAGWIVTEVGRQPWIIYEIMRTEDAVTEVPNQFAAFGGFTVLYAVLAVTAVWLLRLLARSRPPLERTQGDIAHDA
jgi:cytochrome d ubiquinol oxidase subunit I